MQTWKDLACALVICKVWRLAMVLQYTILYSLSFLTHQSPKFGFPAICCMMVLLYSHTFQKCIVTFFTDTDRLESHVLERCSEVRAVTTHNLTQCKTRLINSDVKGVRISPIVHKPLCHTPYKMYKTSWGDSYTTYVLVTRSMKNTSYWKSMLQYVANIIITFFILQWSSIPYTIPYTITWYCIYLHNLCTFFTCAHKHPPSHSLTKNVQIL
jgi:hypothetical protein